jgi:hypothetical protein
MRLKTGARDLDAHVERLRDLGFRSGFVLTVTSVAAGAPPASAGPPPSSLEHAARAKANRTADSSVVPKAPVIRI